MVPADVMDITPLNALIPVLLNVMSPNTAELVAMMLLDKFNVPLT